MTTKADSGCPESCGWWDKQSPEFWDKLPECAICNRSAGGHGSTHPHRNTWGPSCPGYSKTAPLNPLGIVVPNNPLIWQIPANFWDNVDEMAKTAEEAGLHGVSAVLKEYERNRVRLGVAVKNLEVQLKKIGEVNQELAAQNRELALILRRIRDAGIDLTHAVDPGMAEAAIARARSRFIDLDNASVTIKEVKEVARQLDMDFDDDET